MIFSPDSVLSSRYFPRNTLLFAKIGFRPSYTWASRSEDGLLGTTLWWLGFGRTGGSQSNHVSDLTGWWSKLWTPLLLPPKAKHHACRLLHEALPTPLNLSTRE